MGQLTEIDPDVTVVYFLLMLNFSHYREKVNIYKEFAANFGTRLATNITKTRDFSLLGAPFVAFLKFHRKHFPETLYSLLIPKFRAGRLQVSKFK